MEEMLQGLRVGFIIREILIILSLISLGVLTLLLVSKICSFFVPQKKTFIERETIDVSINPKKDNCNLFSRKVEQY